MPSTEGRVFERPERVQIRRSQNMTRSAIAKYIAQVSRRHRTRVERQLLARPRYPLSHLTSCRVCPDPRAATRDHHSDVTSNGLLGYSLTKWTL